MRKIIFVRYKFVQKHIEEYTLWSWRCQGRSLTVITEPVKCDATWQLYQVTTVIGDHLHVHTVPTSNPCLLENMSFNSLKGWKVALWRLVLFGWRGAKVSQMYSRNEANCLYFHILINTIQTIILQGNLVFH